MAIFVHMKEIVEYTDYRKFIQDYYDERKRNSAFTWREFARDAGFSSAVYSYRRCSVCGGSLRLLADQGRPARLLGVGQRRIDLHFRKTSTDLRHARLVRHTASGAVVVPG